MGLKVSLGWTDAGLAIEVDLTALPHLLIGGAVGQGQGKMLEHIVRQLIGMNSDQFQLVIVDSWCGGLRDFEGASGVRYIRITSPRDVLEAMDEVCCAISPRRLVVVVHGIDEVMSECGDRAQEVFARLVENSQVAPVHLIASVWAAKSYCLPASLLSVAKGRVAFFCASKEDYAGLIGFDGNIESIDHFVYARVGALPVYGLIKHPKD